MNYLRPQPHLTYEEVTMRYKACTNARVKTWWQIVWLMSRPEQPNTVSQAAGTVGCHPNWARHIIHRYNTEGPAGLVDKRKDNPGQEPCLTPAQKEQLGTALLGPAPDGGLWTSPKVAAWIEAKTGTRPSDTTGLNYLHGLGFTLQQPRLKNLKAASAQEQAAFKKSFRVVFEH